MARLRGKTRPAEKRASALPENGLVDRLPKRSGPLPDPAVQRRNAEIRRRYAEGEPRRLLATDFDLSQSSIARICQGIDPKKKRNDEIRERYAGGETQRQLAEAFNLTPGRIGQICRD